MDLLGGHFYDGPISPDSHFLFRFHDVKEVGVHRLQRRQNSLFSFFLCFTFTERERRGRGLKYRGQRTAWEESFLSVHSVGTGTLTKAVTSGGEHPYWPILLSLLENANVWTSSVGFLQDYAAQ